jgi:hypothetical protein
MNLIRAVGFIVGSIFLLVFPLAGYFSFMSALSATTGTLIGIFFIAYGLGGNNLISRLFPFLSRNINDL